MMDFLFMATIYTVCFVIISYIVIAGKYEYHSSGLIGFLRRNLLAVSIKWLNYCSIIVFMSLSHILRYSLKLFAFTGRLLL